MKTHWWIVLIQACSLAIATCNMVACGKRPNQTMEFIERQLTQASQGHTIHHTQVFSPDGQWVVYDTRNDDTKIGSTGRIEMVNVLTGEVRLLYAVPHQNAYGPGVGAATFSPTEDRVIFIHGIRNANQTRPYGIARRTAAAIDVAKPGYPIFMDARDIRPPFTPGALRGGTHAHSWSGDGHWICFTYNDWVMEELARVDTTVRDLRTVGVMVPGRVSVPPDETLENHDGERFSVIVARVTEHPIPGSDDIDRAFDECWIGTDGYVKPNGERQRRAIAFQGDIRAATGDLLTEVFVVDLPADLRSAAPGEFLAGTKRTRPNVPVGVNQRRLTFTEKGVSGPRHWLRTTPDGSQVLYLSEDEEGTIQVYAVPVNGGTPQQITWNAKDVQGQFNVHPDGDRIIYVMDNAIQITRIDDGATQQVTARFNNDTKPVGAPHWSPDGEKIIYSRYVGEGEERFLQLFLLEAAGG